jgi:hypothetical protein
MQDFSSARLIHSVEPVYITSTNALLQCEPTNVIFWGFVSRETESSSEPLQAKLLDVLWVPVTRLAGNMRGQAKECGPKASGVSMREQAATFQVPSRWSCSNPSAL